MTPRTHISIVIDRPVGAAPEINRAWAQDEIELGNGSVGLTPAANVTTDNLSALLPDVAEMVAQIAALTEAKAEAEKTAEQAVKNADDAISALAAVNEASTTALAAKDEAHAAAIAALEARVVELTTEPTTTMLHAAYVKQALFDMGALEDVSAAATYAGKGPLWENATYLTLTEPMVVAVAEGMKLDLAEVRARAEAIRDGRDYSEE